MSITTLIASPSPRDVTAVKESIETIKGIPKLYVKYFPEEYAYSIIKEYFLKHTNADYLIIAPDDLLASEYHYKQLVETIEKYGKQSIPTLSGMCNVHNIQGYITQMAICLDHEISPERRHRHYKWSDLRDKRFRDFIKDKDLINVRFSGFPFQFIRRDIVEKIGLDADLTYNPYHRIREGFSIDVVFCYKCNTEGIPLLVNPRVQILHLRGSTNKAYPGMEPIQVWRKDPMVLLDEHGKGIVEDIIRMFPNQFEQYNSRRSERSRMRIVPNPAAPGRLIKNVHFQGYEQPIENRAVRQNSRSAGPYKRRGQE